MQSLSNQLTIVKAQNQIPVWGIPFSADSYIVELPAATDTTITIPANMMCMVE